MKLLPLTTAIFAALLAYLLTTATHNRTLEKMENRHHIELLTAALTAEDVCEERVYYLLLQFNEQHPGLWTTADGPISINNPRKRKVKP